MARENKKIRCLGLIPARAGSKRVPKKNIKMLAGRPLIAYAISAAWQSGVFSRVIVSTDSPEIAKIALQYGAEVPFLRPAELAGDHSPDIEWVRHLLAELKKVGEEAECFSILRPVNPFRQPATIQRAWEHFLSDMKVDSIRAVEKCGQHPAKMWFVDKVKNRMEPVLKNPDKKGTPWHSKQYQSLPEIFVQNASLEIAWCDVPLKKGTIAGNKIRPFLTENYEGFDINNLEDWIVAEYLI
jgi:N-acylneuraminate cytidylyltransferase